MRIDDLVALALVLALLGGVYAAASVLGQLWGDDGGLFPPEVEE